MQVRGEIGEYYWAQFWAEEPELFVPDVIREIKAHVIGLCGVNVSWDSGVLNRKRAEMPEGWGEIAGHAVTPPVTNVLADSWPRSNGGFDEWYFFSVPPADLDVQAFCNWYTFSLGQWETLRQTDHGFNMHEQLLRVQPEFILGEGQSIFLLARNPELVELFCGLAVES